MENKRQHKHSENCKVPFYLDATQINRGWERVGNDSWERVGKSKIRILSIVIRFVVPTPYSSYRESTDILIL
jgi:hypothetical protein